MVNAQGYGLEMAPETGGLTVGDRLQRIETLQQRTLDQVNDLMSRDRADLERIAHLAQRVSKLESSHIWLNRLVIGAVVASSLGLVFSGVGLGS